MSSSLLVEAYRSRTSSLGVIFSAFSSLHGVYHAVLRSANVQPHQLELYEKTKKSASSMEKDLSDQLHTQAFILMTGAAEALLKDILDDLILENFHKLNNLKDVSFTISELKRIIKQSEQGEYVSIKLAESVIRQLSNVQDKSSKINFQSIESMRDTLQRMFGIKVDITKDYYKNIHVYWQKRHALVHSSGVVDRRYVNNVSKVGYNKEAVGDTIIITKRDYDTAKSDFEKMFKDLEYLIVGENLSIEGVG